MTERFVRTMNVRANSYDPDAREFEAILSTGAPVTRRDARGPYLEALDLAAIDPADLTGLPLLDAHQAHSVQNVVGQIVRAWHEAGALVARCRLSAAPDAENVRVKVAEGSLRGISLGYSVLEWEESR